MSDRLLSLAAAAARCGVSTRTLRRLLADPQCGLRVTRIGRRRLLSAAELEVWLARRIERPPIATAAPLPAAFSAPARELLEWAICARKCAQPPK